MRRAGPRRLRPMPRVLLDGAVGRPPPVARRSQLGSGQPPSSRQVGNGCRRRVARRARACLPSHRRRWPARASPQPPTPPPARSHPRAPGLGRRPLSSSQLPATRARSPSPPGSPAHLGARQRRCPRRLSTRRRSSWTRNLRSAAPSSGQAGPASQTIRCRCRAWIPAPRLARPPMSRPPGRTAARGRHRQGLPGPASPAPTATSVHRAPEPRARPVAPHRMSPRTARGPGGSPALPPDRTERRQARSSRSTSGQADTSAPSSSPAAPASGEWASTSRASGEAVGQRSPTSASANASTSPRASADRAGPWPAGLPADAEAAGVARGTVLSAPEPPLRLAFARRASRAPVEAEAVEGEGREVASPARIAAESKARPFGDPSAPPQSAGPTPSGRSSAASGPSAEQATMGDGASRGGSPPAAAGSQGAARGADRSQTVSRYGAPENVSWQPAAGPGGAPHEVDPHRVARAAGSARGANQPRADSGDGSAQPISRHGPASEQRAAWAEDAQRAAVEHAATRGVTAGQQEPAAGQQAPAQHGGGQHESRGQHESGGRYESADAAVDGAPDGAGGTRARRGARDRAADGWDAEPADRTGSVGRVGIRASGAAADGAAPGDQAAADASARTGGHRRAKGAERQEDGREVAPRHLAGRPLPEQSIGAPGPGRRGTALVREDAAADVALARLGETPHETDAGARAGAARPASTMKAASWANVRLGSATRWWASTGRPG